MQTASRPHLTLPSKTSRLLLHTCCAPCSGDIIQTLVASNINFVLLFYNPNIHPEREYVLRKDDNMRFATKHDVEMIDLDYDVEDWFARAKGMQHEPERGKRCTMCFEMRFMRTALYAHEHGFDLISSTLGISRWKDFEQINRAGLSATRAYPDINYWTYNWRKFGGSSRMLDVSKKHGLYQQEYCGCAYSLRDTNKARQKRGLAKIILGQRFYGATKPRAE